jgi:hypothetical protein
VTVQVLTFALSDLLTGVGRLALICPDARYASIASQGHDRIERRFGTPADWREVASMLTLGLEPGPLPGDHVMSRMLVDERQRKATTVQYVSSQPMAFEPGTAAAVLDAHLRAMATRPNT